MISIIGTGYVGLVTGACLAEMGNDVTCVDVDARKIDDLRKGHLPFYEPGLTSIVLKNQRGGRLHFTTDLADADAASPVFIAVGTPPSHDGSADLRHVMDAAHAIGRVITGYCVVVVKSTVPVGTCDTVRRIIRDELDRRGMYVEFDMVSNPEFLKEGDAINDFMRPDRIVLGSESERATTIMKDIYAPFTRNHKRLMSVGLRDAEMVKYVTNTMLATKVSLMNEVANLCEHTSVDVDNVRRCVGSDSRIGHAFIYPGCGYGGSCFPKDVKALKKAAEQAGFVPTMLNAVEAVNESQKRRLFEKVVARFGTRLEGHTFSLWGLSFKPDTDDMREAPSLVLLGNLIEAGARVQAYDPAAMEMAKQTLPAAWFDDGSLKLADHQYDALAGADAMILVTEWRQFRQPDFNAMKKTMRRLVIFDGRNQYDPLYLRAEGFEYFGIGR
ncbi:UDP-glucose dehydrogenase family protein [Burkholderia ubonensis]|uniref:UDP-glucose dehydrogenase family protein n=1 Tax=Burkholderia ubonensis TaxID=101571 RepID=UPI00075ADE67|nr:UDP-glucose/GDP-mannose dehydrogenase family protein [Burkholderia ubonensis]KVD17876.1 UDP-glucose 6-dehydrogenase [Burkholderia ubonensis]KVT60512.1 UDP-glucose 6-dehydrogenase [Burkholderia ubonensis]KWN86047.1 UDP-glucose 6-dehydrogenase [Burkholderia ubonensis]